MLQQYSTPKRIWAECMDTAIYARKQLTSRSIEPHTTPYHAWQKRTPDLAHLRIVDGACCYLPSAVSLTKLDARSARSFLVGNSPHSKGYKEWDIDAREVDTTPSVRFSESSLRVSAPSQTQLTSLSGLSTPDPP